jgi:hypothetical protein
MALPTSILSQPPSSLIMTVARVDRVLAEAGRERPREHSKGREHYIELRSPSNYHWQDGVAVKRPPALSEQITKVTTSPDRTVMGDLY